MGRGEKGSEGREEGGRERGREEDGRGLKKGRKVDGSERRIRDARETM